MHLTERILSLVEYRFHLSIHMRDLYNYDKRISASIVEKSKYQKIISLNRIFGIIRCSDFGNSVKLVTISEY